VRTSLLISAALASALLLWAASPAVGAGWLAWVAIVPAAAAALRSPETRAGRAAVPLAYTLYLELLLVPALPVGLAHRQIADPPLPVFVGESPVLVVALLVVPLFGALLYALRFPWLRTPGDEAGAAWLVLVPALAWTALDLVRVKLDPGGLFGPLFLSQHDLPAAVLASPAGPWLLTLALVAVNCALALAVARPRAALRWATACCASLAVVAVAAAVTYPSLGAGIAVAAVQPGYDTAEFEDRPVLRHLDRGSRDYELATLDLARDLAPPTRGLARRRPDIVVWPEATAWVDPHVVRSARTALAGLAQDSQVALVVPYFLRPQDHGAALVALPDGSLTRAQPKQRPMWFLGEAGDNRVPPEPVLVEGVRLGTLLGVDNQDPGVARALVAAGAEILASTTHDWKQLARQQRAFSQLHAAALAVPVVRADWRYGSAVYDAGGREVADAGSEKRPAALLAEVRAAGGLTPYARIGDVLGWAAVAAAAALGLWAAGAGFVRRKVSEGWPRHAGGQAPRYSGEAGAAPRATRGALGGALRGPRRGARSGRA
jgi:apolipoprotein N-acyltransferase